MRTVALPLPSANAALPPRPLFTNNEAGQICANGADQAGCLKRPGNGPARPAGQPYVRGDGCTAGRSPHRRAKPRRPAAAARFVGPQGRALSKQAAPKSSRPRPGLHRHARLTYKVDGAYRSQPRPSCRPEAAIWRGIPRSAEPGNPVVFPSKNFFVPHCLAEAAQQCVIPSPYA